MSEHLDCSITEVIAYIVRVMPKDRIWDVIETYDETLQDFVYTDEVLYEKNVNPSVIINHSEKGSFIFIAISRK